MTAALLAVSLAMNVAAAAVLILKGVRHERAARRACESCPFVAGVSEAAKRISVPVVEEPTSMFRD